MGYTTNTAVGGQKATYPEGNKPLYVFTPYYIEVETLNANEKVELVINSITALRYSNASKKAKFPVSELIRTFFSGVDFGNVDTTLTNEKNAASKLMQTDKTIVIKIEDATIWTLTYDLVWGALQNLEDDLAAEEIYFWDDGSDYLPLTITERYGDDAGKDYFLSEEASMPTSYTMNGKVYTIKELPYCAGGTYLRWIAPQGEYKYFYFLPGILTDELKDGNLLNQSIWSNEVENGQIYSDKILFDKAGNPIIECTVLNADYNQQLHLMTLQRSVKQWVLEGSTWVECRIEMEAIQIDRFRKPKEVIVKVIKPALFLQKL